MHWLIRHAMVAFYPRTDALPGIADTDVDGFLARFSDEAPPLLRLGLVAGALAFTLSPLLTVYWPLPSFLLPPEVLDRHADRVTRTRLYLLRQAVFLVKLKAGLCWGADPEVRRRLACAVYPPDPKTLRQGSAA